MKISLIVPAVAIFSTLAAQRFDRMQCGPSAGNQKCPNNLCCSQYGWCGTTTPYCNVGCQSGFGRCKGVVAPPVISSSAAPIASSSTPSGPIASSSPKISKNGRCGTEFGGQTCQGSEFGNCCSQYNWCGKTKDHCQVGCQSAFGTCSGSASSSVSRSSSSSRANPSPSSTSSSRSQVSSTASSSIAPVASSSGGQPQASSSVAALSTTLSVSVVSSGTSNTPSSSSVSVSSSAVISSSLSSAASSSDISSSSNVVSSSSIVSSSSSNVVSSSSVALSASSSVAISSSSATLSFQSSSAPGSSSPASSASSDAALPSMSFNPKEVPGSTMTFSVPSPSSTPASPAFERDPLTDPNASQIDLSSQNVQVSVQQSGGPPGSTGSFLSLLSTDGNAATINVYTQPVVQQGTKYIVSVWLKSIGASVCSVDILVDTNTIRPGIDNIPLSWTEYTAEYFATTSSTPLLSLNVQCGRSQAPPRLRFKREEGDGLGLGSLSMDPSPNQDVVSSSIAASSSVAASSSIVTPSSIVASSSIISTSSDEPAPTPSADISSTPASSIPVISSSAELISTMSSSSTLGSSYVRISSSVTAVPSISASATTPASCTPTIIDGGFENFDIPSDANPTLGLGTSNDWSYTRDYYDTDSQGFFANSGYGPSYAGGSNNVYTVFTKNSSDASYDIKYKHPVSLCAGTSYDVSGYVRTHRRNSVYSEGCRITALLNGEKAWTYRAGAGDQGYKYKHGVITPSTDVADAELVFRVNCLAPQNPTSSAPRGIKIDSVEVLPLDLWTLPGDAKIPTRVTSVGSDTLPTPIFPSQPACQSTEVSRARQGCDYYEEIIQDPGFEICSNDLWRFLQPVDPNNVDWINPLDQELTAYVQDEKHSGDRSLRAVFQPGGGEFGLYTPSQISTCAERSYVHTFSAKQASEGACVLSLWWRGLFIGSMTPPVGEWATFNGRTDVSPLGPAVNAAATYELRFKCSAGGLSNAVWVDDISFQQVTYTGPSSE